MSMPSMKICCRGCSFVAMVGSRPLVLRYHLPDGLTVDHFRAFGWCDTCANVTEVESLPDRVELEQSMLAATPRSGFLDRLFRSSGGGSQDARTREFQRLSALLRLIKLRESGPRCLHCGGVSVTPLRFDSNADFIGPKHSCGASLYQAPESPDAPRFMYRTEVLELDVEGLRLDGRQLPEAV